MKPVCDYHMHTPLCGHATGTPEEYAAQALKVGLTEIGFSDHAPLVSYRDPSVTMDASQLPEYHKMIEAVREKYVGRLEIKFGIEADFIPGFESQTLSILQGYPYDYVIGSVHFIEDWAFDNPKELKGWEQKDTNKIYRQYFEYLRRCAQSGMFDIMGHIDLVKKFGHRPTVDMTQEIAATAEAFKAAGVVVEVNTSGLRKPVKEIYPSVDVLKVFSRVGIPLTFGSDAHAASEVGKDFDQAREWALAAGYKEYVLFRQRKIEKVLPL